MQNVIETYNHRPKHTIRNIITFSIIAYLIIWSANILKFPGFFGNGIQIARGILNAFFNPDWSRIFSLQVDGIPVLIFETLGMAFLGTLLGAVLSIPFAFLTAKNIVGRFNFIGNTIITTIRSFPFFLTAMMLVGVSGPGQMTAVITIGILSIGMISKLFIEAIEDIDPGILQSLDALGATTYQKIRYGIVPQLTASFLSITIYRFEINIKNATILGLLGAGGIGSELIPRIQDYSWRIVSAVLWGIIIVVWINDYFSTKLRKKLMEG